VAKRYKVILMRYLPLLLLMLAAVPAEATEWRMQSGSEFTFEATFESVASPGRFAEFDVVLEFDAADPGAGRLRVTGGPGRGTPARDREPCCGRHG
jgi:polyisoprenoid-binding protein YceI